MAKRSKNSREKRESSDDMVPMSVRQLAAAVERPPGYEADAPREYQLPAMRSKPVRSDTREGDDDPERRK